MVAANIANEDAPDLNLADIGTADVTVALTSGTDLDDYCVTATHTGGETATKGPGC
jgi:hypothetical protein